MPRAPDISASNSNIDLNVGGYPGVFGASAQNGGSTTTIVLAGTSSSEDGFYVGAYILVTAGAAAGSVTQVTSYDGATTTATVTPELSTAPDATSVYNIYGYSGLLERSFDGVVFLGAGAPATDGIFAGCYIYFHTGAAAGLARLITEYDGATGGATLDNSWESQQPAGGELRGVTGSGTIQGGDAFSIFGEGGTLTGAAAGEVVLPATALGAATDDFYADLIIEVLNAGNATAVGQSRRITAYTSGTFTATLESNWTTTPTDPVVYRIFAGWGGEFEEVTGFAQVATTALGGRGQYGLQETRMAHSNTGRNANGDEVVRTTHGLWGSPLRGTTPGDRAHTEALLTRFVKETLVVFSHRFEGGFQTKLTIEQDALDTHRLDSHLGPDTSCGLTRSVVSGVVPGSDVYSSVAVDPQGRLVVNTPRSAFGDGLTVTLDPQIQMNFSSEIGDQELIQSLSGSQSTIRHEGTKEVARIGDSPVTPVVAQGDLAVFRTKRIGRYRAGLGSLARFTSLFDEPDNSVWQFAGLATAGVSLGFGYFTDGVPGLDTVKFGVNRSTGGELEIRTLEVTGSTVADTLQLTLPNLGAASGSTTFDISVGAFVGANEIARAIAEDAVNNADPTQTWSDFSWEVQNVGAVVTFRSVGVGDRSSTTYTFNSAGSGVSTPNIQSLVQGVTDSKAQVLELDVVSAATANGAVEVVLNSGISNFVALLAATHDTPAKVAWQIVNNPGTPWVNYGNGWAAKIVGTDGTRIRFTGLTPEPRTGANTFTDIDGTGADVNIFQRRQTGTSKTENWTFQENWNVDRCDGTGPSRYVHNPTKGGVYAIGLQYLGFGRIEYFIENGKTSELILVHRIDFSGTSLETNLSNPHLSLQASVFAVAGTAGQRTHSISVSSWAYFTQGPIKHIAPRFNVLSVANATFTTNQETPLILIKHPEVFNEGPSLIGAFIQSIVYGLEAGGGNISSVRVRLNPAFIPRKDPISPKWEYVNYPDTPILVAFGGINNSGADVTFADSTDGAQVNGGISIAARPSAGDVSLSFEELLDFELDRGDILAISLEPTSGGSPNCRVDVSWVEDH